MSLQFSELGSFGENLGLALLTGGSARYRIYTAAGLDGPDVARVVAIASGTFPILPATIADRLLALKMNWDGHDAA